MKNVLVVHDLATGNFLYEFPLDIGSVVGFSGKKKHRELFYKFSSMIKPGVIYHVDMTKSKPTPEVLHNGTVQIASCGTAHIKCF